MTENERYGGKDYVEKGNKGSWVNIENPSLSGIMYQIYTAERTHTLYMCILILKPVIMV